MPKALVMGTMIIGIISLVMSAYFSVLKYNELSALVKVPGTIVSKEIRTIRVNNGVVKKFYYPLVTFKPADIKSSAITITLEQGSETREYKMKEQVTLLYPPLEPKRAKIYAWMDEWMLSLATLLAGLVCLLLGGIMRAESAK